jgi:hypothetical protein
MSVSEFDETSGHADGDVPMTEPEVVHNLLLDGVTIIRNSVGGMRAVGWEAILDADGAHHREARRPPFHPRR